MFRKQGHGDVKKSAQKVTETKKDSFTRLKHLKHVLDCYDSQEAKAFFQTNYSHIYYIFFDNFVTVETDLKQRASKAHREELDQILHIFEKILVLLPELLHERWMFHSIGCVMKKLLHPVNCLKLRKEGMRLFLIWYQILQENASEECHQIYLQLVPGMDENSQHDVFYRPTSPDSGSRSEVNPVEILPILGSTGSGEKIADNVYKHLLDGLLQYMVSEVIKVEWINKEMQEASFVFLFNKFKSTYLNWLFPNFDKNRNIYDPVLLLPCLRKTQDMPLKDEPWYMVECRDSFICWLADFTGTVKKSENGLVSEPVTSAPEQEESEHKVDNTEQQSGSNASTLSTGSQVTEKDSLHSSTGSVDHNLQEYEIVRSVLYSSRENVNIVHEAFRQALLFSFKHTRAIRKVVTVYKDWFQHVEQLPVFMQEPSDAWHPLGTEFHQSLSDIMEEEDNDDLAPNLLSRQLSVQEALDKSRIRNPSYLGAIQDLADGGEREHDVRVGLQKVIQLFITNAANIFLLETEDDLLVEQIDLCKRVIHIYRFMVKHVQMEQKTWEQLLKVLLCVTSGVLQQEPSTSRGITLGGRLAQPIFQTLIVTWISANLHVVVGVELWDHFLEVLSSLTSWAELIREWAKTMETVTRVLARQVYGLDLYDLPLQRLSEQKEKRRRGKSQDTQKPKTSTIDKTFLTGWSQNDGGNGNAEKTGSAAGPLFERGKYKSDGADGKKSRPDLTKQRSLSGEPSPSHSRSASSASAEVAWITRSSSDSNLTDPMDLAERLTGAAISNEQDVLQRNSVFSMESSDNNISHEAVLDHSGDSISSGRSDMETLVRSSQTPSPVSLQSECKSRSPSPCSELAVDIHLHTKGSPTPDRDSLHIDMVAGSEGLQQGKDSLDEFTSVLSGGTVKGWLPDVAVVLWRRMFGALGNINQIEDADNHVTIYEYLCDHLDVMIKMRNNMGVTVDNFSSPQPPELVPPQRIFAPWLFECLTLSNKYKNGKLLAYQLLCQMMISTQDFAPSSELLSQFYNALQTGLMSGDQETINVIVKYCGSKFLSAGLPGSTLLINHFISAAGAVLASADIKETPRVEAVRLLGALVCFPNHMKDLPVLETDGQGVSILTCDTFKENVVRILLKAGRKEPAGLARCAALNSIGIFLCEELMHDTMSPLLKEGIAVLLGALRCLNKMVAKVASDMLTLLGNHIDKLLKYYPALPRRIIEVTSSTISTLIPSGEMSNSEDEKELIQSMMFCIAEWCMRIPMHLLLETSDADTSCIQKVFEMLNTAVAGHSSTSLSEATSSLVNLLQDNEVDNTLEMSSSTRFSSSDSLLSANLDGPHSPASPSHSKTGQHDCVKLAARTLINHLMNHLNHFPMGSGPSRLNTLAQEHHDISDYGTDDLKQDIFSSHNVQFFLLNKKTLITFVELPALLDVPGGGVTAGLTTARTVCRVILRDLTGKYCWESSVLYAPPWCEQGSYINNAKTLLGLSSDIELEPLLIQEEIDIHKPPFLPRRSTELPLYDSMRDGDDNLNDMLRYVGQTSPECVLISGVPLNLEAPIPEDLCESAESTVRQMVIQQKEAELDYYSQHKSDAGMLAKPQMPSDSDDPVSPFQMCRLLLDQMGLLAWEKRTHFDLLRKSDKLLREMKNLDNQKCRETHKFAVLFIAEGQEDRQSVLSNDGGSKSYEEFVAGLGWEVELELHQGFLGGLQQNKTTGETAPYFATSTYEVIFHVSTRMPSGTEESMHVKMRHLGNDEVHIVWSEHVRDYRRGIIPTEFGDVLIIIYPLPNGLCRIQINRKPELPHFGPLFDGAMVDHLVLPGLVRATAINASRVKRSLLPLYHSYFEERTLCLDTIINQHIEPTMFEDFAASVFAPVLPPNSTISEQSSEPTISSSSSSVESDRPAPSQTSPPSNRQSRGSDIFLPEVVPQPTLTESLVRTTARRLSGRKRHKTSRSQSASTPPRSPNMKTNSSKKS
ncbi:hypothetical protein ScPMuIL_014363 [Solemya velum]